MRRQIEPQTFRVALDTQTDHHIDQLEKHGRPDTAPEYGDQHGLGLNDQQIRIIQMMTPKRDYYYMSDAGNRRFELGLGLAALAFCGASTAKDQALIDELYAQHGTGTAFAHAWLEARGLEAEAAELLRFDTEIAALMGEAA